MDKFNPQGFFPTPKVCHNKFYPVFDPSKDIMLGIEGIRIIPGSEILYTLPNPTSTRIFIVAYSSIIGMQVGNAAKEVICHMVREHH